MGKLEAKQKNYKNAFTKHANAYDNWNGGSNISKRLILCYCVECGLKCLIMKNNRIHSISQADEETAGILGTHDFRVLLKAVRESARFQFKDFQTEHDDVVTTNTYHQFCRYAVEVKNGDMEPVNRFDATLQEIENWLKEVI